MTPHILITEDHQDVFENLIFKLQEQYTDYKFTIADNCDTAIYEIERYLGSQPVSLLILDLTFKHLKPNTKLKRGNDLLKVLKEKEIHIPTIIYSSHDDMSHIYPIMNNYEPEGYVIKSNTSSGELLLAVKQVLYQKKFYSTGVHEEQFKRFQYSHELSDIDLQIIKLLPDTSSIKEWEGKILLDGVPITYKTVSKHINKLKEKFEVDNDKQLVLKLYKLAII